MTSAKSVERVVEAYLREREKKIELAIARMARELRAAFDADLDAELAAIRRDLAEAPQQQVH